MFPIISDAHWSIKAAQLFSLDLVSIIDLMSLPRTWFASKNSDPREAE
jgi:hypothetical protein